MEIFLIPLIPPNDKQHCSKHLEWAVMHSCPALWQVFRKRMVGGFVLCQLDKGTPISLFHWGPQRHFECSKWSGSHIPVGSEDWWEHQGAGERETVTAYAPCCLPAGSPGCRGTCRGTCPGTVATSAPARSPPELLQHRGEVQCLISW